MPLADQFLRFVPRELQPAIGMAVAFAAVIFAYFRYLKQVEEGQVGIRKRWGKVIRRKDGSINYLKPGHPHFLIPFAHGIEFVSVLNRTIDITPTEFQSGDQVIKVDGVAVFKVEDAYKVRYAVDDFDSQLKNVASAALLEAVSVIWSDDADKTVVPSNDLLYKHFASAVEASAEELGVSPCSIRLTTYRTDGQFAIAAAINNLSDDGRRVASAIIV